MKFNEDEPNPNSFEKTEAGGQKIFNYGLFGDTVN